MRSPRPLLTLLTATTLLAGATDATAQRFGQGLLKRFMPVRRVAADASGDYTLTETNGPWLVMAATFPGEGAEQQARELALEFRRRFNLPAYVHAIEFDRSGDTVGRGIDEYGVPIRMKYRKGDRSQEWAVLVGDFPSIDDPAGQKLLNTIKTMRPETLAASGGAASGGVVQASYNADPSSGEGPSPLRAAFMARNPALPQEYFVPKGVDKLVEKMNRGVEHGLLNNKKRYTVKVATFTGRTELQGGATSRRRKRSKPRDLGPLEEAALNAHDLTVALREAGYEAYEFHDRTESIVTIGGFDSVTRRNLSGGQQPTDDVIRIIRTFDAGYDTPVDPLENARLPDRERARIEAVKQQRLSQFKQMLSSQGAGGGMAPKFARVQDDSKGVRVVPFDVHPQVIEVPKRSISAGFAWRNH